MTKKVYVLGAGFPAQADLPTLNNFFPKVREKKDKTDSYEGQPIEKRTFERVLKLEQYKDDNGKPYNMESAFTAIYHKKIDVDDKSLTDIEQLKKDFLYTVCRTFHLCWTDGGRNSSSWLYRRFLEVVIKEQSTLITFNYDLILENLLFKYMKLLPYYGFELNEENTINFKSNYPLLKESGVTFLKMHGSQHWFKCNSCNKELAKIDLNDNWASSRGEDKRFSSGEECIKCPKKMNKMMDYLIVPPLIGKEIPDEELLKAVWKIAECKMREAEEIVFIGYSFPESDKKIQDWFKKLLGKNIVLNSLTVIDPNADKQDFKVRFNEILKEKYAPRQIHEFPQVPRCNLTYIPKTFLCWFLEDVMKTMIEYNIVIAEQKREK